MCAMKIPVAGKVEDCPCTDYREADPSYAEGFKALTAAPLYQVFERIDGKLIAETNSNPKGGRWATRRRVYTTPSQARVYKRRLTTQGRDAVIIKFIPAGIVE